MRRVPSVRGLLRFAAAGNVVDQFGRFVRGSMQGVGHVLGDHEDVIGGLRFGNPGIGISVVRLSLALIAACASGQWPGLQHFQPKWPTLSILRRFRCGRRFNGRRIACDKVLCSGSLDTHEQTPTGAKRRWCACPLQPVLLRRTRDSVNELSGPTTRRAIYPGESRPLGSFTPDGQDARRCTDGLAELLLRHTGAGTDPAVDPPRSCTTPPARLRNQK